MEELSASLTEGLEHFSDLSSIHSFSSEPEDPWLKRLVEKSNLQLDLHRRHAGLGSEGGRQEVGRERFRSKDDIGWRGASRFLEWDGDTKVSSSIERTATSSVNVRRAPQTSHAPSKRVSSADRSFNESVEWRILDGEIMHCGRKLNCSLLYHPTRHVTMEFVHSSPDHFFLQLEEGGELFYCTREARVRPAVGGFKSEKLLRELRAGGGRRATEVVTERARYRTWRIKVDVSHAYMFNTWNRDLRIHLLHEGFVMLGVGADSQSIVYVEGAKMQWLPLSEGKKFVRNHFPLSQSECKIKTLGARDFDAAPGDQHEGLAALKECLQESMQRLASMEEKQDAYLNHLLDEGDAKFCRASEELDKELALGKSLSSFERKNKRVELVEVVTENEVAGGGCSTELAFCIERVRRVCEQGKHRTRMVFFFRKSYHSFSDILLHLSMQLGSGLFTREGIMEMVGEACEEGSWRSIAMLLRRIILALLATDTRVYVIVDNCSRTENRLFNMTLRMLRGELQPWKYPLSKDGLVRFVASGKELKIFGYGVLLRTIALKPLQKEARGGLVEYLLKDKLVAARHLESLTGKNEAGRALYLRAAADIIRCFGCFELSEDAIESLPDSLEDLYMKTIEMLEMKHGSDLIERTFAAISAGKRLHLTSLQTVIGDGDEQRLKSLKESLLSLLRLPPEEEVLFVDDEELQRCIGKRYSGNVAQLREEEQKRRQKEAARLSERLASCNFLVVDAVNGEVGFNSLERAVEETGWDDAIVVQCKRYEVSNTIKITKNLTIRADGERRGAEVRIALGRTALEVMESKDGRAVKLTLQDVRVKQVGNETVEVPTCIAVGPSCSLQLTRASVTSVFGVGLISSSALITMEQTLFFQCGRAGVVLEKRSKCSMRRSHVMVNPLDEVPDRLGPLYQLFLHFCETKFTSGNRLSGMGKRSVTLDFSEFLAMMKSLEVELDKTTLSSAFQRANSDALSDKDRNEMNWNEFKLVLRDLCVLGNKQQVLGIDLDELELQAHKLSDRWVRANAVEVTGGSELTMEDCELANAMHGVLVMLGSSLTCHGCSFHYCGRENDSAAVTSRHARTSCLLSDCRFLFSENNGVQAEAGSRCELKDCTLSSSQRNGITALGAQTRVEVRGGAISGSVKCGISASQRASVLVEGTRIERSMAAAVSVTAAETTVELVGSTLEKNGRGIVCEREGTVLLSGMEVSGEEIECSRKGVVEYLRAEEGPLQYQQVVGKESARRRSSISLRGERKEGCVDRIKRFFAKIFTNVAEAYVVMKQRRGDILTMQELAQGLEALGVEENMGALEAELAGRRLMESREMSAYSFVCAFQWHESSAFEGGLWESAIIDARRNKRQLMTRLLRTTGIKELAPAPPPPRFHVLQSNLLARVRRRKDFSKQIRTRMLSGDRSKERSQGIQLVHGGQAYKGWEEYRRMRRSTSSSP